MTEMKDLGKELFFFAWLKRGTDEDSSLTLASSRVTPSPTSQGGEKWDLNEDRPEGGPAGPKSPGRGDCFSSGTGWPGGKGYGEGGGKGDRHASAAGSAVFFLRAPRSPPSLQAARPPLPAPAADSLFWPLRQVMEERPPLQLSTPLLFSPDGCAVLQSDSRGFTSSLPPHSLLLSLVSPSVKWV